MQRDEELRDELLREYLTLASQEDDDAGSQARQILSGDREERLEGVPEERQSAIDEYWRERAEIQQTLEQEEDDDRPGAFTRFSTQATAPFIQQGMNLAEAIGALTPEQRERRDTVMRDILVERGGLDPAADRGDVARQVGADGLTAGLSAIGGLTTGVTRRAAMRGGQGLRSGRLERNLQIGGAPGTQARRDAVLGQGLADAVIGGGISGAYTAGDPDASAMDITQSTALGGGLSMAAGGGITGAISAREGRRAAARRAGDIGDMTAPAVEREIGNAMRLDRVAGRLANNIERLDNDIDRIGQQIQRQDAEIIDIQRQRPRNIGLEGEGGVQIDRLEQQNAIANIQTQKERAIRRQQQLAGEKSRLENSLLEIETNPEQFYAPTSPQTQQTARTFTSAENAPQEIAQIADGTKLGQLARLNERIEKGGLSKSEFGKLKADRAILLSQIEGRGRKTDTISSFLKNISGELEETAGGKFMNQAYSRVVGRLADRNEAQAIFSRGFNDELGKSNRWKRQNGNEVGRVLRKAPDNIEDMSPQAIARAVNTTEEIAEVAQKTRRHFRSMLDQVNAARRARGQEEIPFRTQYMPQWAQRNRSDVTLGEVRFYDSADEAFNPFSQQRTGQATDFEENVFRVMDDYHRYSANEIHLTPVVRDLRKLEDTLNAAGMPDAAKWLRNYIDEGILRRPTTIDSTLGLRGGTKQQRILEEWTLARNLSGLGFNIKWMLVTQPNSLYILLTKTAGSGSAAGLINPAAWGRMFNGMSDFLFKPEIRREIQNLDIYRLKRSQGVGTTLGGQVDWSSGAVLQSRRQFVNEHMALAANTMEKFLDGTAAATARRDAMNLQRQGRMTHEGVSNYMNHAIEVSQSVYTPEMRPQMMQSLSMRAAFPFQTYSFEMWRHVSNTIRGKGSGFRNTKMRRLTQATNGIVAMTLFNIGADRLLGDSPQVTPGSFIPIAGSAVDRGIDEVSGLVAQQTDLLDSGFELAGPYDEDGNQMFGQGATAIDGDVIGLWNSVKDYIDSDEDFVDSRLRKELVSWGMGLGRIPGASTANRLLDSVEVMTEQQMTIGQDDHEIPIEMTPINMARALIGGPWTTTEGREVSAGMNDLSDGIEAMMEQREAISSRVNELLEEGDENEARRIIREHNAEVEMLHEEIEDAYGDKTTPASRDYLSSLVLSDTQQAFNARMRD